MTAARSAVVPPELIAGRYRIEAQLGQGGMGSVWKAQHLALRSAVAIKLIDPALATSEKMVARFMREAQAAASLRSAHVVQILDHGVDQGVPYIVMELLEGESLEARLARSHVLSATEVERVMTHIARAMTRAHESGIVHRDLKPANVFLVPEDDEEITKVLDFGVAKITAKDLDVVSGTRTGDMLGTPYYMSPEQVEGDKAVDYRTDLWAMAVIACECLTGVRPFEAETLGSLLLKICAKPIPAPSDLGHVPAGFDAWFAHATQRQPSARFQSAREMVDALRGVLIPRAQPRSSVPTPAPRDEPIIAGPTQKPPPVVAERPLFLQVNGQRRGPYDFAAVERMVQGDGMSLSTPYWREGMADWRPLRELMSAAQGLGSSRLEPASLFKRSIAWWIDAGILLAPCVMASNFLTGNKELLLIPAYVVGLMCHPSLQGTLGMKLMKLKIVDPDGGHINLGKSILRFMVSLTSALFFGFGYISALFSARKQTFHDLMAGTLVVKR